MPIPVIILAGNALLYHISTDLNIVNFPLPVMMCSMNLGGETSLVLYKQDMSF